MSLSNRVMVGLSLLIVSLGCQGANKAGGSASSSATAPGVAGMDTTAGTGGSGSDVVVATWASGKMTLAQLDEKLGAQLMNLRRQGLESAVNEMLIKDEAKKRGLNEDQLMKAEIEDKVTEPTDAEIQKLVDEARKAGQLPESVTLEQVKPQAAPYLKQKKKQELQQAFIARLRKQANVKLTSALRVKVPGDGPSKGPEAAPITIVEFSDFECPFCKKAKGTVDEVLAKYPGKIKLVFRQFPLGMHPHAEKAAEAALCAADQNKFWQLHDKMFDNREHLTPDDLKGYAKDLGLDGKKFDDCLTGGAHAAQVKSDQETGSKLGVNGTPAFFINGVELTGAVPVEEFAGVIDGELASN